MSTYRVEWDCCGSVTETEAWEPESCPFCTDAPKTTVEAAAPDLLEALQKLLSHCTFDDYPNTNEWYAVRDARAAIARATGETA